jgi:hypothetical protein
MVVITNIHQYKKASQVRLKAEGVRLKAEVRLKNLKDVA